MALEMVPTPVNMFGSGVSLDSAGHVNGDVSGRRDRASA